MSFQQSIPDSKIEKRIKSLEEEIRLLKSISTKTKGENDYRSSSFIDSMFDSFYDGITISDAKSNIIDVNSALVKMYGYDSKEEMIGLNIQKLVHKDYHQLGIEKIKIILEKGTLGGIELICIKKDGSEFLVDISASVVYDSVGNPIKYISISKDITLRKQMENTLLDSEIFYKTLFKLSPSGILLEDFEGNIVDINPAMANALGYPDEDLIGVNVKTFSHPDRKEEVEEHIKLLIEGKQLEHSVKNLTKEGSICYMLLTERRVKIPGGKEGILVVAQDVTNLKNTEDALKQSLEDYKSLLAKSPLAIEVLDKKGTLVQVNKAWEELWQVRAEDSIQKYNIYKNTLIKEMGLTDLLHKVYSGEKIELPDLLYNPKNYAMKGRKRWLHTKVYSIKDNLGNVKNVVLIHEDITETKKTQEALKESEERFRTTFNYAADSIFLIELTDNGQIIRDLNEAAQKSHGYSKKQLINKPVSFLEDKDSPTRDPDQAERILSGEHLVYETTVKHKDGTTFPIEVSARKILINNRPYIYSIERDISDRIKLERQLRHSQKLEAIGTLAGGIAHDFNNILAAILGYSELTMDDVEEGSIPHSNLKAIFEAGERAKELIEQILTFSSQKENELRPVKMSILVKEAIKFLQASLPSTVELKQKIVPNSPMVMADPSQIHQIVMNLCTNAYQAIEKEEGWINISLDKVKINDNSKLDLSPGEYLKLIVQDSGTGIDRVNYEKIFDPFFTTKHVGKGTGLGLSVVHGIIIALKGIITVSSTEEGTTFSVYLPTIKTLKTDTRKTTEAVIGGSEKIMLVEDDQLVSGMTKQLLESFGYHVKVADDSLNALQLLKEDKRAFDLVITDQIMPKMTGLNLSLEILKINKQIPIILMTGLSESLDEEIVYDLGIKGYISKPVSKNEIGKLIRDILDRN